MAKFNKAATVAQPQVANLAGGAAYSQKAEEELAFIALTSLVEDQFYRSGSDTLNRVKELVKQCTPEFVAKVAIYAREVGNMRSITHVLVGELAEHAKGMDYLRNVVARVCKRPDDMAEILSYWQSNYGKKNLPAALRFGLKEAFNKFNNYQLGKYGLSSHEWTMIDMINVIHPIPTEKNALALREYITKGNHVVETWETEVSANGAEAWADLLKDKKLGYMALLKNVRNIMKSGADVDELCKQLTNEEAVKKSKQFPYRFYSAYKALLAENTPQKVLNAVSRACDIAVSNAPNLDNTLIAVDTSGSMFNRMSSNSEMQMVEAAFVLGASLFKGSDAELMTFDGDARYIKMASDSSVLNIVDSQMKCHRGGSTNMGKVFSRANKAYDRIIILSDMQSWQGLNSQSALTEYKNRYACNPHVYVIDLAGYGTGQFKTTNNIHDIAGLTDKVFDVFETIERGSKGLLSKINAIDIRNA